MVMVMVMAEVPDEVTEAILLWLPIKSLMRFKCVGKSWYDLIHNPYFREQHSALRPDATHLLIPYRRHQRYPKYEQGILTASPDGGATSDHTFPNIPEYRPFNLSSCHGLISMHPRDQAKANTYVYNPNTRETLSIPFNANAFKDSESVRSFIGFEPVSNQYKLMILSRQFKEYAHIIKHCEIITLGTKDWRQVVTNETCPVPFVYGYSCTCLNGALHWLTFDHRRIVVFDLKSDKFGTLLVPEGIQVQRRFSYKLRQVHGRLILVESGIFERNASFELWTLKDYSNGVWVNERFNFSVSLSTEVVPTMNNDEILITLKPEVFVVYNMKTKKIRKINVIRREKDKTNILGHVMLYTESMRCC